MTKRGVKKFPASAPVNLEVVAMAMYRALKRVQLVVSASPDIEERLYDTMGYVEAAIAKAEGR